MDSVHIHLLLNHVPVITGLLAVVLLGYSVLRNDDGLKQLSLLLLVVAALVTIPVYLTGEPAEEVVEDLAGVSHDLIEAHEDAAKLAMIFMMITGALSLLSLVLLRLRKELARWVVLVALLPSLVTAGLMVRAANLGGQIRHSEIRTGETGAPAAETRKSGERKEDDHD